MHITSEKTKAGSNNFFKSTSDAIIRLNSRYGCYHNSHIQRGTLACVSNVCYGYAPVKLFQILDSHPRHRLFKM
jgi:hypothetical protein